MVVAGQAREPLRVSIGYHLGAVYVSSASSAGASDGSTIVDTSLRGGDDDHNGKWAIQTSGTNDGVIRQVKDYVASTQTLTVEPVFAAQVASGVTYELWDEDYNPALIHDLQNQAMRNVYGRVFDPVEDLSLFADGKTARLDLPTDLAIINKLQRRYQVSEEQILSMSATFDETASANITQTVDTEEYKESGSSLKLVYAAGAAANELITDSFTAIDLSKYTHIEIWVKPSITIGATDLEVLLDDSAACASPIETLVLGALTADVWTRVRVALATPELDTAIISAGFRTANDIGACTLYLDDLRAVNLDTAVYRDVPLHLWRVAGANKDLLLSRVAMNAIGYAALRIQGGDEPAVLTGESSATQVYDAYVIAYSTALALLSRSGGAQTDPDERRKLAQTWFDRADRASLTFPVIENGRLVG